MRDEMRVLIGGVAESAARGAAALREQGVAVELDAYSVEVRIVDDAATAEVRLEFVVPRDR